MPVGRRALSGWQTQSLVALWFAVLLAITPYARPALPGSAWLSPSAAQHQDIGLVAAEDPAQRLRGDQPDLGLLPRAPYVEAIPAPPPDKSPLIRPRVPQAPPAMAQAAATVARTTILAFHRSAIGTARTPTGPPA